MRVLRCHHWRGAGTFRRAAPECHVEPVWEARPPPAPAPPPPGRRPLRAPGGAAVACGRSKGYLQFYPHAFPRPFGRGPGGGGPFAQRALAPQRRGARAAARRAPARLPTASPCRCSPAPPARRRPLWFRPRSPAPAPARAPVSCRGRAPPPPRPHYY
ncbi:MAG: hypothetical protein J3K34DRAFT_417042 [Monoraphidium minutum]|nr:MAG: hypothetical protein J3K34DRAFT_417042 [Monoraphidium minutum]